MFNFIDIYRFIHVSGSVGRGPSALLVRVAYYVAKTALVVWLYYPFLGLGYPAAELPFVRPVVPRGSMRKYN